MVTRSQVGIVKPNPRYAHFAVTNIPAEPKTIKSALCDPCWTIAMQEELQALRLNNTWELVPRHHTMHIIGSKWVYKTKLKADGSLERLKGRLVAKGYDQIEGLDFSETLSPVIKPGSIRLVLTIATMNNRDIWQLDVKNAFLHGYLSEPVFMEQPSGFVDPTHPNHVCRLKRALYGLKQAPSAWFDTFSGFLLTQ